MSVADFAASSFASYHPPPSTFDEALTAERQPRECMARALQLIEGMGESSLRTRQRLASRALLTGGITFSVNSDRKGGERIFPFDIIPRIIDAASWRHVQRGLIQRVQALNAFLQDIYGPQRILAEGAIPRELVLQSKGYLPTAREFKPAGGVYAHVGGIDLLRDTAGNFLVLEDNLRCPSGVSYVLENRGVMKRVMDSVLSEVPVRSVDAYPAQLRKALHELSPIKEGTPRVVVLTPGPYNSAYFEHSFLARRMGCELVHPSDLVVHNDQVFVKTTAGPQRVHVIYRRIDDEFLDPDAFRRDSLLGVRGLVRAYARGQVTLANAIGNGVADDKGIYPYVPAMIRFYLSEEPLLGQVETFSCVHPTQCQHVLSHLASMVVKRVDGSGGYGILIGPNASHSELADFAERIKATPHMYIAQPLIQLSSCPTWTRDGIVPRRVDWRPFVVTGNSSWVLPGGLTRVASTAGSYVVNSSQGGSSKDTWVLEDQAA